MMRLLAVAVVLALASPAGANTTHPQAKARLAAGVVHFEAGQFEEALVEFEASYAIDPDPDTLFSVAMAERKTGRCARALPHFRTYLASRSDVPSEVQGYVFECWLQATAAEPHGTAPARTPWYKDPVGGAVVVGTAGLAVGVGFLFAAHSSREQADSAQYSDQFDALLDEATGRRRIGVTFLVGGALLAGGGIAYHYLTRTPARPAAPTTSVGTDGRTITFARSF